MASPDCGFRGVYPVAFALFDREGELCRESMRNQTEAMIRNKVHGITTLGLASETNKLSLRERHTFLSWIAEDVRGRVPVAVTIAEPNARDQIEFARNVKQYGFDWVILQPPPTKGIPEIELVRFFGVIADKSDLPVGIQNAPEYLGYGLSVSGIKTLIKNHPNVVIAKLETTALGIKRLNEELDGSLAIFNGKAGIDIVESTRAGAAGFIPGGECYDVLVGIYDRLASGGPADKQFAETAYKEILPLLSFLMESVDHFLVYGKKLLSKRLAINSADPRAPFSVPHEFGLDLVNRYAKLLGPLIK